MDPVTILKYVGGQAERAELLRHCTRHALARAVAAGTVLRVRRGRYVLPGLPEPRRIAAEVGGALSHATAAAHWGLDSLLRAEETHIVVPANAHPSPRKAVRFHYGELPGDAATGLLPTVLDCAATMPFREALAIADSACRTGFIEPDDLRRAATARQGRGRGRMLRVARHTSPLAANPFESALRAIAIETGITGFSPQHEIAETGFYAVVDLGDPVRRIVMEADSFAYHGSRQALRKDCHRYSELASRDWTVLRFAWEHVMFEQPWVSEVMLRTCCQ